VAKSAKTRKKKATSKETRKVGKEAAAKSASEVKSKKAEAKAPAKKKQSPKKQAGGLKGRMARAQALKSTKQSKAAKQPKAAAGSKTLKFLREVRLELSKVTWPNRDELVQSTVAVLVAVAISGAFIFLLDVIFSRLIGLAS
jgi:preprotein translocase subunit SecE